jgi:hypothetical protein
VLHAGRWRRVLTAGPGVTKAAAVAFASTHGSAVLADGRVYISSDAGLTWTRARLDF